MQNIGNMIDQTKIDNLKQQHQKFQQEFDNLQAVIYWKQHVPVKEWHLKQFQQLILDYLNWLNSDNKQERADGLNWLDQLLMIVVKQAVLVHTYSFTYISRVAETVKINVEPFDNLMQFNTATLPKPTFEEQHPISEDDLKINKLYQKQKRGRLSKVGSLMNYGGRTDYQFKDFTTPDDATKKVLLKVKAISEEFKQGHYFNTVFTGKTGRGKTMLAIAIMNDVNQNSLLQTDCMIVSMAMYADILMANLNGDRISERNSLERRMFKADLVIWDDFGSDTSMKKELREANDTTQKAIFRVADARTGKANIITTNHSGGELDYMYNSKIISRLMTKDPQHVINFDDLPDRRMN